MYTFDPFGIFKHVLEMTGIWGILAMGFMVVMLIAVLALRARLLALTFLFIAMCFSSLEEPFETVFVAIRWICLICLVPLGIQGFSKQGYGVWFMCLYAMLVLIFSVRAFNVFWSLQRSIALLLLIIGASGSLQSVIDKGIRFESLFKGIAIMGTIWAVLNILPFGTFLGTYTAERYAGVGTSVGYNSLVMGLLFPFTIWGVLHQWPRTWRIISGITAIVLVILMLFVATRGGAFLALIASIPILLHFSFKRFAIGMLLLMLIIGASAFILQKASHKQQQFILRRYAGKSELGVTTGRAFYWKIGLRECLKSPFLGHGSGTGIVPGERSKKGGGITLHNSYLSVWYEGGIISVIAFVFTFVITIRRGILAIIRSRHDPEFQLLARTMLGITLGLAAFGMVESTLAGATNILVGMHLLAIILIQNLWVATLQKHSENNMSFQGILPPD